jgi:hypothetical protein
MRVDDDVGSAEGVRRPFGERQQHRAMAAALQILADADQAQARLSLVDQVDPHRSHHVAVVQQHVRKAAGPVLVRIALVIGLAGQQRGKDRIPADRMIGGPLGG